MIFLLVLCSNALSQKKISVSVKHQGSDTVGTKLAYEVRESIRRSQGYAYSPDGSDTVIEMVTAEVVPNGASSIVSVVIIKHGDSPLCGVNLAHLAYYVGSLKVQEIADDIVATLDKQVGEYDFLYTKQ